MNQYQDYFDILEKNINKPVIETDIVIDVWKKWMTLIKKKCCDNPEFLHNNTYKSCINCGVCKYNNIEEVDKIIHLNPNYNLTTEIGYCPSKYNNIRRIHKWKQRVHTEYTMMKELKNFDEVKEHFNIDECIIENAKHFYKKIYLDNKIYSRGNVRISIYIYCIYYTCVEFDFNIVLEELLHFFNVTLISYIKGAKKVEKELDIKFNLISLQMEELLQEKYELCMLYLLEINEKDVLRLYNQKKIYKGKSIDGKFTRKTIILGIYYQLLKSQLHIKEYCKIFGTSPDTIKKTFKIF